LVAAAGSGFWLFLGRQQHHHTGFDRMFRHICQASIAESLIFGPGPPTFQAFFLFHGGTSPFSHPIVHHFSVFVKSFSAESNHIKKYFRNLRNPY
jgi:hypothetical protein